MTAEPVNLFAQQEANRRRTRWLVMAFLVFFAWLGFGGDYLFHHYTLGAPPESYHHVVPWFGIALTLLGGGLAWYTWRRGPESVLWSVGAREVIDPVGPEQQQLVNVVEEMAIAAGVPRPRIHIVVDDDPNAFATGRDPQSSHVAVTSGLLRLCSRDELQAVVAHEMAHIRNFDVRLMTILAGLVGAVALMADGLGRMLRHGFPLPRGGSRGGGKKSDLGPLLAILLVVWLVSWLLAPLVTRLLALGVSRKREYLADATAAQLTRNPLALASALEKIERAHAPTISIRQSAAHLCIADPVGRSASLREGWLADTFGTHPPMRLRVARLKAMAYQELKRTGQFPAYDPGAQRPVA